MEVSIFTRIKITIALVIGILLVGFVGWNLLKPDQPLYPVVFYGGQIGVAPLVLCCLLGLVAGFISTFLSKPYGKEIGVIAAPAGLCFIGLLCGDMTELIRNNPLINQRTMAYSALKWESILWMLIPVSGLIGVIIANIILPTKSELPIPVKIKPLFDFKHSYLAILASIVISAIIAHIAIGLVVRDVVTVKQNLTALVQPNKFQIAFGVYVSFFLSAFVVKLICNSSYIWPCLAAVIVSFVEMMLASNTNTTKIVAENWPIGYFIQSGFSILPIQMVGWGCLGAITGFWAAIRYNYWKKFQSKPV